MSFLAEPTVQYKDSFIEGVREFQQQGTLLHLSLPSIRNDFSGFLKQMQAQKDRRKIAPDLVPTTTFWLIDNGEFIGVLSVRHELNDFILRVAGHIGYQVRPSKRRQGYGKEILRLGIEKAREIGITRVLVTCDENNIASKKVIEYNGGHFEDAVAVEGSSIKKLRYWFDMT